MHAITGFATRLLAVVSAVVCMSCTAAPRHAAAQPPGFPDLSGFAPVPADNYIEVPPKGLRYVHFSTPYNIQCWFEAGEPVPVWQSQDINCLGDMPDGNPCTVGKATGAGSGPAYVINRTDDKCGAPYTHGAMLNIGQKVNYRDATCAVGADHLVACLDTSSGQHGFVLKPAGSVAF
ncbi:hypothetical protein [Mycobacterium colombiense]|uniref:hypothetical protein n=1 Tax=Mycobacterium colombiense TaxID=339268 RepID=UPI000949DA48|nr:hypothetical protein [Mycobacterium colombiense]